MRIAKPRKGILVLKRLALLLCTLILAVSSTNILSGSSVMAQNAAADTPTETPAAAIAGPLTPLPTDYGKKLDQARATLDQIGQSLQRHELRADDFDSLQAQIPPLQTSVTDIINHLTPRLAAIKQRLDQLGPKPADNAPPESPAVTAERADQQKAYSETDELLKRAKLLSVQADQTNNFIITQRRGLITRSLFARVTSPLAPSVWTELLPELPNEFEAVNAVFKDGFSTINERLVGWRMSAFWGMLATIAILYWPAWRLSFRFLSRQPKITEPTMLQKALAAWWSLIVVAVLPVLVVLGISQVMAGFGINDTRLQPFFEALGFGTLNVTSVAAISNGFLSMRRPKWRLVEIDDARAQRVFVAAVALAVVVAGVKIIEALNQIIYASLPFGIVTRATGALLGVLVLFVLLFSGSVQLEDDDKSDDQKGASYEEDGKVNYISIIRLALWGVSLTVMVAVLAGFIAFGNFLLGQVLWVGAVICLLVMAVQLADSVLSTVLTPSSRFGRRLIRLLGLHRGTLDIVAILLSGILRVIFLLIAIFCLLAPWGWQSNDVSNDLGSIFFGFKIGGITISLSGIIMGMAVFAAAYLSVHAVQKWLDTQLLPKTRLDSGIRNSIRTSLGYLAVILAVAMSSAYIGINFERLALLAGALSVGIGFGLQSIINNFVSGLILLWERAVRVGDWIVVGGEQGFVRKINVRSTEIETFDRAAVIIPNSNIISGVVKNLVRNDTTARIVIKLTVSSTADPENVRTTLLDIAKSHEMVMTMPSPQVLFTDLTGASLSFDLICYVADVLTLARVKSDLHFEICRRFKEEKFFNGAPPDPTRVDILGLDHFGALIARSDGPRGEETRPMEKPTHQKAAGAGPNGQ
ncbi:DUF3772 domain-containing protein [Beijerinckia mobilis]|uniref:DUF3772 domain-containing protein n=1 Tax=Beijerinckia mobilis TaxID=231434 RepID=UPI0005578953|nr:DUF3772 domain-containing protein [Beijerinckia mobilis]